MDVTKGKAINSDPLPTFSQARGKMLYISKDLDPAAFAQHIDGIPLFEAGGRVHLDNRNKPSNAPIYGKKTGVSRNIDLAARTSHSRRLLTVPS